MRGGEAQLVGRERELAALESALDEARDGRGLMVALVGEPGIGKSRLALEIVHRAEADGFATAWTSSRSYASAFPYHLVSQLVPQLMERPGRWARRRRFAPREVMADEETLDRWAAVIDDVLGEGRDDDPRPRGPVASGQPADPRPGTRRLLRAGSAQAHRCSSCSTTSTGRTPPASRSSRSC